MNFCIPTIGTNIRLINDWQFQVCGEHRNISLLEALKAPPRWQPTDPQYSRWWGRGYEVLDRYDLTLQAGTVLMIDRLYVRKGNSGMDSMTFTVVDSPDKRIVTKKKGGPLSRKPRFWVSMEDANKIEFEVL